MSGYYRELSETDQALLKQQIQLEREKIVQEHAILELTDRCERRQQQFRRLLDEAAKGSRIQNRPEVEHHLSTAMALESEQRDDLARLRQAEKRLIAITKQKLKSET